MLLSSVQKIIIDDVRNKEINYTGTQYGIFILSGAKYIPLISLALINSMLSVPVAKNCFMCTRRVEEIYVCAGDGQNNVDAYETHCLFY